MLARPRGRGKPPSRRGVRWTEPGRSQSPSPQNVPDRTERWPPCPLQSKCVGSRGQTPRGAPGGRDGPQSCPCPAGVNGSHDRWVWGEVPRESHGAAVSLLPGPGLSPPAPPQCRTLSRHTATGTFLGPIYHQGMVRETQSSKGRVWVFLMKRVSGGSLFASGQARAAGSSVCRQRCRGRAHGGQGAPERWPVTREVSVVAPQPGEARCTTGHPPPWPHPPPAPTSLAHLPPESPGPCRQKSPCTAS